MPQFIKEHVALAPYTYFKIGGAARYFAEVHSEKELLEAIAFAKSQSLPFVILGAGSNMLVSDHGFQGVAIRMLLRDIKQEGTQIHVGAGMPNAVVVANATKDGLRGMEWMIGIPGSVGGSVRGNAGCYSGEMKDIVSRVRFFNQSSKEFKEVDNEFCQFGYRTSVFKKHPEWIITEVTLQLRQGDAKTAQKFVRHYTRERAHSQDIGPSSAGCLFKNARWPEDPMMRARLLRIVPDLAQFIHRETIPTSFLIDRLGLKGRHIGRARISSKHANFVINEGGATAEEVIMLAGLIKEYVHRKFDIHLEEEIQMIGF